MAYSTLGWQNGQEPAINAENLNHMDQGIADADAAATAAATIAGQASAALEGKLSKQTGNSRVYTNNPSGVPASLEYAAAATPLTIPYRTEAGNIYTAAPTADGHATTKKYVVDRVQANPTNAATKDLTKLKIGNTIYGVPKGYSTISPVLTSYQNINGYTWKALYDAMRAADTANIPLYLSNADRWLYFGTNRINTICNQFVTFILDEVLYDKYFFTLKYVKEISSNNQQIEEIKCSITSTGLITAVEQ